MADFEVDTRVDGAAGRYVAELRPAWNIWGPNGGYLCAIALRAVGRESAIARPVAFYGHYLRVAKFERVEIQVEALARGRRAESFQVRIAQDGAFVFAGMVRTAIRGDGLTHDFDSAPTVPRPEELPRPADLMTPEHRKRPAFWDNMEARVVQPERYALPMRKMPPRWIEWFRFEAAAGLADPFVDAGRSLVLLDTLSWPSAWMFHGDSPFIAPSLDLAAWFHRPAQGSEWLLAESVSPVAEGGTMAARARVWDDSGRLVASSGTQLLCVPAPKT
jgi:acyl-CoA thioesterase-2